MQRTSSSRKQTHCQVSYSLRDTNPRRAHRPFCIRNSHTAHLISPTNQPPTEPSSPRFTGSTISGALQTPEASHLKCSWGKREKNGDFKHMLLCWAVKATFMTEVTFSSPCWITPNRERKNNATMTHFHNPTVQRYQLV